MTTESKTQSSQSSVFYRSFSVVSAWCVVLAVLGTSFVRAAEFTPFLTLKIAPPETIINITEKISNLVDPSGAFGIKTILAPYKKLSGVNASSVTGLALQINENSSFFGLDTILVLPITSVEDFNVPGLEMYISALKPMLQQEGNKFIINSPVGNFVAFQQRGYLIIATVSIAEFAENADPKTVFAGLDKFTLGASVSLENIPMDNVEVLLGQMAVVLSTRGMAFDPTEVLESLSFYFEEFSSLTGGMTLDEKTLNLTLSALKVPKKGSEMAATFRTLKNARTMFGGFLQDTSKTVFSWSYIDYLSDHDIADMTTTLQLVGSSFIEGFGESSEDGDGGAKLARLAGIVVEWLQECMDFYAQKKSVDVALSFDSDGTFLYAEALEQTELLTKIGRQCYNALPELFGEEGGKALQTLIDGKMKQDYETVAEFSLSCLPDLFAEVPAVPRALRDLPITLFWAIKADEAVAVAVGLDFAKTEKALKDALGKTRTPVQPKQTVVFALKPFGEFLLKHGLPFAEKLVGMTRESSVEYKELLSTLVSAESGARVVVTTEFPNDALFQKYQIDGKCFNALIKCAIKAWALQAKRAVRELQKQREDAVKDF